MLTCFRCHSVQTYATMRSDSSESRLFFSWTRSIHWSIVSGSEPKTHTQLKQDLFILSRHHTLTPFGFTQPTNSAFWDAYKTVLKEFPCMQGTKNLLNWFHLKKFTCKEQINKYKRSFLVLSYSFLCEYLMNIFEKSTFTLTESLVLQKHVEMEINEKWKWKK